MVRGCAYGLWYRSGRRDANAPVSAYAALCDGANLAMQDPAHLALVLAKEDDWKTAVQGYETEMFQRAEIAAAGARDGINDTFSENGLSHVLRHAAGLRG